MNQPNHNYTLSQLVNDWRDTLQHHLPCLSKPQATLLALFSIGLARGRRCTLSVLAEGLAELGKPDTLERRLQRFLASKNGFVEKAQQQLMAWLFKRLPLGEQPVLLVDETSLGERLKVMAVSLAYQGRAVVLCWKVYGNAEPRSQVDLIDTLLERVAKSLPSGATPLVETDRGIGCSPALLRAIAKRGWRYLVRVPKHVHLRLSSGEEVLFGEQIPAPCGNTATSWVGEETLAFKKSGWLRCRALAYWSPRSKEPWLLLTNSLQIKSGTYALRMWEEAAFKDFKSNGWQWERSHVYQVEHANRLWLAMAVAYVWMLSLGAQATSLPSLKREVTRGRGRRRSLFQLGLRLFSQLFLLFERIKPLLFEMNLYPPPQWAHDG